MTKLEGNMELYKLKTDQNVYTIYAKDTRDAAQWCTQQNPGEEILHIASVRSAGQMDQPEQTKIDPVNHPPWYTRGRIEVADFIADQGFCFDLGAAIKYLCRAEWKDPDKTIEDLEKAIWFIKHRINWIKSEGADTPDKDR
jgi:hypothetical protein